MSNCVLDEQAKEDLIRLYRSLNNKPNSRSVMIATLECVGCYQEFIEALGED